MMRLLTILICLFFLNGCFSKSVDCDAVVNHVLYDEGGWFFNSNEKIVELELKEIKRRDYDNSFFRSSYIRRCEWIVDYRIELY